MSKEKQIEEMARTLLLKHHGIECFRNCIPCGKCTTYNYAETIYNAGYRKQSEGEWETEDTVLGRCCTCSVCGGCPTMEYKYCPYCGAHMRKEDEGK